MQNFVTECEVCQRNKYQDANQAGLLQPLPIPTAIWEDISIDFITGLLRSHGSDFILVVIDRFSKYLHFMGLRHPFSTKVVGEIFTKEVVKLHGIPQSIGSDCDPIFFSNF